jgi:hypothetical protein
MFWNNEERILSASKDEIESVIHEIVEESKKQKMNAVITEQNISSLQSQHVNEIKQTPFYFIGNMGIAIGSSIEGNLIHTSTHTHTH